MTFVVFTIINHKTILLQILTKTLPSGKSGANGRNAKTARLGSLRQESQQGLANAIVTTLVALDALLNGRIVMTMNVQVGVS